MGSTATSPKSTLLEELEIFVAAEVRETVLRVPALTAPAALKVAVEVPTVVGLKFKVTMQLSVGAKFAPLQPELDQGVLNVSMVIVPVEPLLVEFESVKVSE